MDYQVIKFEFINYALAFIEGLGLILSPCILPILPILLPGSILGRKQSIGIVLGFVFTFAVFTYFSRLIVQYGGLNLDYLRLIAYGLIILFGIILISDFLSDRFSVLTQSIAEIGQRDLSQFKQGSLIGGMVLGALTSLIWVPCGGPILASAIVQIAVQKTFIDGFFIFLFFALGSIVPMLVIAFAGKKILFSIRVLKNKTIIIRKICGGVMIVGAVLAAFTGPTAAFTAMPDAPNVVQIKPVQQPETSQLVHGLSEPYLAPDFQNVTAWINSPPLTIQELRGKVVLIDFWTYSCINCVRTLPYLKSWYTKYHNQGLVIVGVHSPEFEFEKNIDNIKLGVAKYQILYPVAVDNNYGTWTNYHNQYWPAHFLIDKNGKVVYEHFGEGDYDITEHNIAVLLGTKNPVVHNPEHREIGLGQTPETYLGYARLDSFGGTESISTNEVKNYTYPKILLRNEWALQGKWFIGAEKIISEEKDAAIKIHFFARKVYVVMGSKNKVPISIGILLNGKPLAPAITLKDEMLYQVLDFQQPTSGILELIPNSEGAEMYTFTFGS
ncbi:MAG: cytochrome c biogenesis protein DipZ [Candidatus Berkiellales bacterium]